MNTKRLLVVAKRIEALERRLARLKEEARQLVGGGTGTPSPFKGKRMSAASRKKISEAMRRRWAAVKKRA